MEVGNRAHSLRSFLHVLEHELVVSVDEHKPCSVLWQHNSNESLLTVNIFMVS